MGNTAWQTKHKTRALNGACHESRLGAWEVLWEDTGELQLAELLGQLGHSGAVLSLVVLEGEGERQRLLELCIVELT